MPGSMESESYQAATNGSPQHSTLASPLRPSTWFARLPFPSPQVLDSSRRENNTSIIVFCLSIKQQCPSRTQPWRDHESNNSLADWLVLYGLTRIPIQSGCIEAYRSCFQEMGIPLCLKCAGGDCCNCAI